MQLPISRFAIQQSHLIWIIWMRQLQWTVTHGLSIFERIKEGKKRKYSACKVPILWQKFLFSIFYVNLSMFFLCEKHAQEICVSTRLYTLCCCHLWSQSTVSKDNNSIVVQQKHEELPPYPVCKCCLLSPMYLT